MTAEQRTKLVEEMEFLLNAGSKALANRDFAKADKYHGECFAIERTLRILGYEVEINTDNCTVVILE